MKSATAGINSKVLSVLTTIDSTMVAPITVPSPHISPPMKFLAIMLLHLVFSLAS